MCLWSVFFALVLNEESVYMSMQPEAQSPSMRTGFLAWSKHDMTRLGSCLGRPNQIN
jgi:hypothetical protein